MLHFDKKPQENTTEVTSLVSLPADILLKIFLEQPSMWSQLPAIAQTSRAFNKLLAKEKDSFLILMQHYFPVEADKYIQKGTLPTHTDFLQIVYNYCFYDNGMPITYQSNPERFSVLLQLFSAVRMGDVKTMFDILDKEPDITQALLTLRDESCRNIWQQLHAVSPAPIQRQVQDALYERLHALCEDAPEDELESLRLCCGKVTKNEIDAWLANCDQHAEDLEKLVKLATHYGFFYIVDYVLENQPNLQKYFDEKFQISRIAKRGDIDVIQVILHRAEKTNCLSQTLLGLDKKNGITGLMHAAGQGHEMVAVLLLNKAKLAGCLSEVLYARTSYGATALMLAAGNNHRWLVKLLLKEMYEAGGLLQSLKTTCGFGDTAQSWAASHNHLEVANLLALVQEVLEQVLSAGPQFFCKPVSFDKVMQRIEHELAAASSSYAVSVSY